MENINYPLDFITLNDVVMQTDYVMYIDLAEGFQPPHGGLLALRKNARDHVIDPGGASHSLRRRSWYFFIAGYATP